MKKRDLITMFLCVPGAGLFALGMCMCLLPEWGAAVQGVWTGAAGIAVLLWAWVLHRIMSGKPAVRHFSGRSLIRGLIGMAGTLALGTGMCMTMCALPGFVDSKNEEKTERNAGYLVVSHSGGGMLRQGTRKGIRRTPANRGMRAHRIVKSLDISEDVCHGLCP